MSDTCSKSISLINTRTSNRGCKLFNIDLNFNETNNFSNYKRGDLILYNNYEKNINNIFIIDKYIENEIILKKYNEYMHNFLDLLINNTDFFLKTLIENDIDISNIKKLNLTFSDFEIYNDKYLMIKNTKCLIDYEKDIKSIKNIISVLNNNFNNKNNLHTRKFIDYLIIYV
jgi:hypothetical protein